MVEKCKQNQTVYGTDSSDRSESPRDAYEHAMALYKAGEFAQAADKLEPLITGTSLQGHMSRFYHARACRREAERLIEQGNVAQAVKFLQRGMTSTPNATQMINFLAECYLKQGDYPQAGRQLSRLSELNTTTPSLRLKEAMSHYLAGNANKSINILESLAEESPANFEINFTLGLILAEQEQTDRSVSFLTKACQLRPENVDAHWKLGLVQGLRGHLIESIRHLQQAHRIEPQNNWLLCHLTLAVKQAKHQGMDVQLETVKADTVKETPVDQSLDKLAELIAREPEFVTAFLDLPQTDMDDQIFSALLTIMMRALERYPEYADLHYHCSCIYHRLGKSDEAIRESEHAVDINPRYVSALIHLAGLYSRTDRDQDAIDRLKSAVVHGANYADVHYLLGSLYHKQGLVDQARRHYQRALNINSGFEAAKKALASLTV